MNDSGMSSSCGMTGLASLTQVTCSEQDCTASSSATTPQFIVTARFLIDAGLQTAELSPGVAQPAAGHPAQFERGGLGTGPARYVLLQVFRI
jgi:hypothetical protein